MIKLPNFYKTRENALVAILKDNDDKRRIAEESIERIVWSLARQFTVLAKADNDNEYYRRILKILDVVYNGDESDFIKSIRNKAVASLN